MVPPRSDRSSGAATSPRLSRRAILAGAALLAAPGLSHAQAPAPHRVVTTTPMLADAARLLAGDSLDVVSLMGPGVDPHLYRPTRADLARLVEAHLVVAHGLGLEAQFREAFAQVGRRRPVVFAGEVVPEAERLKDEDYPDKPDPHVWMDPRLWMQVVAGLVAPLAALSDAGRARARLDAPAAAAAIADLDAYARQTLSTVLAERRLLVTAHDAFGYFARAYGFEVKGVQGLSTESEAGLKAIEDTVTLLVTRRVPAIFVETSVSDRNIRAVIEGARQRGHVVAIGGELFSDSMGAPGTYEGTYLGMIDHNVTTIARALGGAAPARGMSGRLATSG